MNLPPHNSTAEKKIISCLVFDPRLIESIGDLSADEFYTPSMSKIFGMIINGLRSGKSTDDINQELIKTKYFDEYLKATNDIPATKQFDLFVKQVRQTAQLRKAIAILRESAERIQSNTELQYDELADLVINDVVSSLGSFRSEETCYPIVEIMQESLQRVLSIHSGERDPNVRKTGLVDVDNIIGGLWPSDLIIVAGRPAMGKSAFGLTVGLHVSREEQKPVVLFTLEMSRQQEANRVIALETEINSEHLLKGNVATSGLDLIDRAIQTYRSVPLEVDDASNATVGYIRSKSMQIKRKYISLGLIVVDYLQLMRSTSKASREQQISDISRSLKGLAKSINVPVMALAQLSRACELRPNKRPQLSDLRESGAIEQDADKVLFLYRDDYYNEESTEPGTAEVIVTKNRVGRTGTAKVIFDRELTRFRNMERVQYDRETTNNERDDYDQHWTAKY